MEAQRTESGVTLTGWVLFVALEAAVGQLVHQGGEVQPVVARVVIAGLGHGLSMEFVDDLNQGFGCFPVEQMASLFDPDIAGVRNITPECFRMPGGGCPVFSTANHDG